MYINRLLMFIMGIGVLMGGFDYLFGNRLGLGSKFEDGFMCLGPTALSMVGIMSLAPLLAQFLGPVIIPIYRLLGCDPAMFACLLSNDMGGYPLATTLADNPLIGQFSGLIVASMLGATLVFTIPLGLSMIKEEDHPYFAKGLLIGIIPIPIGAFIGGLMMGIPYRLLLINSLPILLIGVLLAAGLILNQSLMIKGFILVGKGIKWLTTLGLMLAAFQYLTEIKLIASMPPILESMSTVSSICIVLLGSLPLMTLLLKLLQKPFEAVGLKLGLNGSSIAGILFSCISVLPVFSIFSSMNSKGKIVTTAFFVSSISVFSAHLGFTVNVAPDVLVPLIVSKLSSGLIAVTIALVMPCAITKASSNKSTCSS